MSHYPTALDSLTSPLIALNVQSVRLTDDQFEKLCWDNPDLRIELTSRGELIVMPPTGLLTGSRNSILTRRLAEWTENDGRGMSFDSSTLFTLPDGSKRSPDACWILREKVEKLSYEERKGFALIVPDFVIELRSPTDRWRMLEEKMADYLANGVRLAWLIDPEQMRVLVYRPNQPVERLDNPSTVSAEPELPGFILNVVEIW
jgi:Uma2 family endonuclease